MRTLQTARLRLEPVRPVNAHVAHALLQAPGLREFQDVPCYTLSQFRKLVAQRPSFLRPGVWGRFEWLAIDRLSGTAAGWISLRIGRESPQAGELGYTLLEEFRGRGLATEALRAVMQTAFEKAALPSLIAYCVDQNAASRRLLKRLRFQTHDRIARGASVRGEPVDIVGHRLTRERWAQSKNSIEIPASA